MRDAGAIGPVYRFGAFDLDPRTGEFRKYGVRIKLQEQPLQILLLLVQHPGSLVTREQIQEMLWGNGTYVDYDHAINSAIRKLRDALGDAAETPRFIETLPRRGYRFVGNVQEQHSCDERVESPSIADHALVDNAAVSSPPRKFVVIGVLGGALLVLAIFATWFALRREAKSNQLVSVPLTAAEGSEFDVTFSPDGSQVAYAWDEKGNGSKSHIYLRMIGVGRPVRVTAGPHADYGPTWSPNGGQIAFIRDMGQSKVLYLIEPVGGTERKVAEGQFRGSIPWSRDGRFLAVADINSLSDSNPSLYLISPENGQRLRPTVRSNQKSWDQDPAFAPNGRRLLFTRCDGPFYCGLYLLDLTLDYHASREPLLLRRETRSIGGSAWTQDGTEVVYAVSDDGGLNHHLMRIRLGDMNPPQRLAYAGERSSYPAIAGGGNRLAYTQDLSDFDIWRVQAGKAPQSFLASTRLEYNPEYSPDGKRIAFSSNRSGMMELWVCDQDGGNQVQLSRFERHSGSPQWSPDGRWIAFDRHLNEGWRVFVTPSDHEAARRVTSDDAHEIIPSWSRDGRWIYYASNRTGRFEVWKAPTAGGPGRQVTRSGGFTARESIDGKLLYYTKFQTSGLWALPVRGGAEKLILESVRERAFVLATDGIYYIPSPNADGLGSVSFYEFATGQKHQIAPLKQEIFESMTVSPDRKTILFSVVSRSGSNVMVVENFR